MAKKIIIGGVVLYLAALAVMSGLLFAASPGPEDQVLWGVRLGSIDHPGGIAWLSGRRFTCTDGAPSTCTFMIDGQTLAITASRSESGAIIPCQASFAGQAWECSLGNIGKTVGTGWFATMPDPQGITPEQMSALRARYPIENLSEQPFLIATFVLPILNVIALIALLFALLPPPVRKSIPVWAGSAVFSVALWLGSVYSWMRLTNGFWD